MVKHKGLCPSLKKSVEFDVNEVIELKTKRGTKYQVKGDYEGRTCSTFCSKAKAMELKSALGQTIMSAETEDETGQSHQDESVAPMDNNVQPLSQGQEPMADMPVQETVATPITGTSVGVEAIDNLQLNDADALTNMATQFDDAPDMVADFEIAPQEPEGDGRSIGNIRPMNEDVPLHAESEDGTGQAHQEEGVSPIETDVQPLAQGQEPMENMPVQETVATPITNSSVGVEAIDNLQLNDADALTNMATQFDEAPEMLANFEISFMQPFGDGQSIGNNTPMNPDVPLHAETVESPIQTVNPMDETTLTTPPPVCFVEKIPPVVWEDMSVLEQIEYAETGNEGLLSCPQCGITKADLRDAGGYCAVSDPEGSEYNSSVDCPYQKHFAPSHWLDEEYVVGHVEGDIVEVSERLPARVDMPKMKNPQRGLEEMVVPYFIWDKIYTQFNGGITAEPDLSGLNYTLQFHGMMKPKIKNLIKGAEGNHDIMFGSETYTATVLKAEGDGGYFIDSTSVRPYEAETFEAEKCICKNYTPDFNRQKKMDASWSKIGQIESYEWDDEDDEQAVIVPITCDDCGRKGETVYLYGYNEYDDSNLQWFGAETFEAEQCKHEEYYVIGMDGDEWNEGGENFAMLEIECESCGVRGKGETNLSYDTAPNREHNRIWWEDIGFEAETFGVEFDDWADQEMLTHGKMVSFKKWAKEEGKKHGDMDLTDWAEHEEESHDERYGAEAKSYTDGYDFTWRIVSQKYAKQNWKNEEIYWLDTSNDTESLIDESNYEIYTSPDFSDELFGMEMGFEEESHDERYEAELLQKVGLKEGSYLNSPNMDSLSYMRLDIYPQKTNKEKYVLLVRPYHISKVSEKYLNDILTSEYEPFPYGSKYSWANEQNRNGLIWDDEIKRLRRMKTQEKEIFDNNEVMMKKAIKKLEKKIKNNNKPNDDSQKQDKPSLKSVGLLLGVGALATYFAPKGMREFFNRLK